ncbi:MAG: thioredoxin family protein [Phycisphaerales bacterium]|nr:thioredoxin family protein [Phycisphaerales bacterium]
MKRREIGGGLRLGGVSVGTLLAIVVLFTLVIFITVRIGGSTAATPEVFAEAASETLAAAIERSRTEGRPVFALVTADWCPPCQTYKRTTLADESVQQMLRERSIPFYIDADTQQDDLRTLSSLGLDVRGIPATVIIADGKIVAHPSGVQSKGDIESLLARAGG